MSTCDIGKDGEDRAIFWLESKGYKIIQRNFRRRGFEIDIVALDKNKVLRFIEVKTIKNGCLSDAVFSIEQRNISNYVKGVEAFIASNVVYSNFQLSMDALIVESKDVHYYENITQGLLL